jgi:predicted phosphodiesterase
VEAHTHAAPVILIASLQEVRIEEIKKLLDARREDLAHDFETATRADLRDFVSRQLLLAGLGGLMAPMLMRQRRKRTLAAGVLVGAGTVGLVLMNALTTFQGDAFEKPTYTGALKQAPWVIAFGQEAFTKLDALSQKLHTAAANFNVLYGRIAALPDTSLADDGPNTFRILHVSDLHDNTAGVNFVRDVAAQFKVAFIVDTGDLTDFGSVPETYMVRGIANLPYPYLFVAGNHDSHSITDALRSASNVTVLNGQVVTLQGVTLLGLPNPASDRDGPGDVDAAPQAMTANGEKLLKVVQSLPAPPDIIAVHDPQEAIPLWNHVPLVLFGHEHRDYVDIKPETDIPGTMRTVLCNAGTTGAAGFRYLEKEKGVPFSCAVLTFRRPAAPNGRPTLRSIDMIRLSGSLGEYSIVHTPITP